MRLLCCGSREWPEFHSALFALRGVILAHGRPEVVIEGEARGADVFFRAAAEHLGIPVERYEADWITHDRAAGPIRNQRMLVEGKPTHLIALVPTFDVWSGTMDMVTKADKAGLPLALLTSRDEVETWCLRECPFGPLAAWLGRNGLLSGRV